MGSEEASKIKAEIEKLESALEGCTDSRIREVIEIRLEERRLRLAQAFSGGPPDAPNALTPDARRKVQQRKPNSRIQGDG